MSKSRFSLGVGVLLAVAVIVGGLLVLDFAYGRSLAMDGVEVRPTLEHRTADGGLYTPSTQSLLRTHSWLEGVRFLTVRLDREEKAEIDLEVPASDRRFSVHNLPVRYLVPRLHYRAVGGGDAMDAFNLMLAEYSRNSLSVPLGQSGDSMAHYRTDLPATVPWVLTGDYQFAPNPDYRPQRFSVVNNCLAPGLWELSAVDRSGEIYHGWFSMRPDLYFDLVAKVNDFDRQRVAAALAWSAAEVPIDLGRLRKPLADLGEVAAAVVDEAVSFSSQGSRRKLHRDYVLYEDADGLHPPARLSDLQQHAVAMTSFVEPGLYASQVESRSRFDFGFLAHPAGARVTLVSPRTDYAFDERRRPPAETREYIEIALGLEGGEQIVIGNLPLDLLVRQEDFAINGFGVGILSADEPAERREFLIDRGPRPSFAYLARPDTAGAPDRLIALNSHGRGLEQIFLRSHPDAPVPHFTLTISSYERIVDIVKYRIDMPASLIEKQLRHSERYLPPIYFTYRDDNVN